jgi:hypothetical protein
LLWKNLPDFVPDNLSFLPICDVSGSMSGIPMEVSISLGIYLSQRNKSAFKDGFITFSKNPQLQILSGDLSHRIRQLATSHWEMNTNIKAVFELILTTAVRAKLSVDDMPTHLLIISDMQFDEAFTVNDYRNKEVYYSPTIMELIDDMYNKAGYKRPNIIFWNVRTSEGVPAKVNENNVGLVSGYSPSLMKNVLNNNLNPINQVLAILNNGRYEIVDKIL